MAKLIYIANASINGCTTDSEGKFDFTEPDDEVHKFMNDLIRDFGTHLYGRRMYETMKVWETDPAIAEISPVTAEFAEIWKQADKVVYSTTLPEIETKRTRLERRFDPAAVSELMESSSRDLLIGGPHIAAHAFRAGLVSECHIVFHPIIVPDGTKLFPDDVRIGLELIDTRAFDNGVVCLRYKTRR